MPGPAPDELAAWLRLLETPGLGREGARVLLAALGTPPQVFATPVPRLREVVGPALAEALSQPPAGLDARLQSVRAWLDGAPSRQVLTLADREYPARLLNTADPPLLLYVEGDVALLSAPSVAIVGSRRASPQGLDHARLFARRLGEAGVVVVSGLAQGIDGAAHQGALDGPAGTVAVIGTGPDLVFPRSHQTLARRIAAHGVLVSEYPPGTPPPAAHFPQRNRIVTGLALGTLVVEAALRSGSLISARLAAEAGRDVWAIPGSIHAEQSRGCHALIRQGATLVESPQDILDDLRGTAPLPFGPAPAAGGRRGLSAAQDRTPGGGVDAAQAAPPDRRARDPLLEALGADPMTLDTLSARTGWGVPELNVRLLELELDGQVARLPGGRVQRRFAG